MVTTPLRRGGELMEKIVFYFFEPNYISLINFIGVALLCHISLLNFNYVLQKHLPSLRDVEKYLSFSTHLKLLRSYFISQSSFCSSLPSSHSPFRRWGYFTGLYLVSPNPVSPSLLPNHPVYFLLPYDLK